jgi:hypothetical protein
MNQDEQGKKMGQVIAKAWADEEFKRKLLADATAVLKAEGIEVPDGVAMRIVENTDKMLHLVIPSAPASIELSDDELRHVAGGASGTCGLQPPPSRPGAYDRWLAN